MIGLTMSTALEALAPLKSIDANQLSTLLPCTAGFKTKQT